MLAFDSKDLLRRKIYQDIDEVTGKPIIQKEDVFYTPLGVGVEITETEEFKIECLKAVEELANEFQLKQKRLMYDSYFLRKTLSHKVAIPFCDKLVTKLEDYFKFIHFTYVILPPEKYPFVRVGGFKTPAYEIRSAEFLRKLQPMFSYLSAWSYYALPRSSQNEIILDGFVSKQTNAWNNLINRVKPKIYPHGDECNPFIMIADIIAYLTDSKLYTQKIGVRKEYLEEIWKPYGIEVDSHYLDYHSIPQYGWNSDEPINIDPYLAHPMIFLAVDDIIKLQPKAEITEEPFLEIEDGTAPPIANSTKGKGFREIVRGLDPWFNVTAYAYYKGGSAQFFDVRSDLTKLKDGDTIVYIGNQSKQLAEGLEHIHDIEVLSAKEVRKNVNRQKGNTLIH